MRGKGGSAQVVSWVLICWYLVLCCCTCHGISVAAAMRRHVPCHHSTPAVSAGTSSVGGSVAPEPGRDAVSSPIQSNVRRQAGTSSSSSPSDLPDVADLSASIGPRRLAFLSPSSSSSASSPAYLFLLPLSAAPTSESKDAYHPYRHPRRPACPRTRSRESGPVAQVRTAKMRLSAAQEVGAGSPTKFGFATRSLLTRLANLELQLYPQACLQTLSTPVTTRMPSLEIKWLVDRMRQLMYGGGGVGIAAPQVGVTKRVIMMNYTGDKTKTVQECIMINPIIEKSHYIEETETEGCLSFPGLQVAVRRPVHTVVRYTDLLNRAKRQRLSGVQNRIFLHEFDHLEGTLLPDRARSLDAYQRGILESLRVRHGGAARTEVPGPSPPPTADAGVRETEA
eukprot:GHVU01186522.1.p1 GENE.GHVU01186522.1~~GHVU01186522.1.p1  ORF type:complete len:395 (+),score=39.07 GHVU01186522.1:391-1575(+)